MTENAQTLVRDLADQAEVADTGGVRNATLLADATLDAQDGEQPGFVLAQEDG